MDIRVRAISVGQPHKAVPITVALACAAASKIQGSTVRECSSEKPVDPAGLTLGHASGRLMVGSSFDEGGGVRLRDSFQNGTATDGRSRLLEVIGRVFALLMPKEQ